MSTNFDGGAAFPRPFGHNGLSHAEEHEASADQVGMSLRDYFAAKFAHAEMVTSGALPAPARDLIAAAQKANRTIEQQVAFNAYKLAAAMLAERAK